MNLYVYVNKEATQMLVPDWMILKLREQGSDPTTSGLTLLGRFIRLSDDHTVDFDACASDEITLGLKDPCPFGERAPIIVMVIPNRGLLYMDGQHNVYAVEAWDDMVPTIQSFNQCVQWTVLDLAQAIHV